MTSGRYLSLEYMAALYSTSSTFNLPWQRRALSSTKPRFGGKFLKFTNSHLVGTSLNNIARQRTRQGLSTPTTNIVPLTSSTSAVIGSNSTMAFSNLHSILLAAEIDACEVSKQDTTTTTKTTHTEEEKKAGTKQEASRKRIRDDSQGSDLFFLSERLRSPKTRWSTIIC